MDVSVSACTASVLREAQCPNDDYITTLHCLQRSRDCLYAYAKRRLEETVTAQFDASVPNEAILPSLLQLKAVLWQPPPHALIPANTVHSRSTPPGIDKFVALIVSHSVICTEYIKALEVAFGLLPEERGTLLRVVLTAHLFITVAASLREHCTGQPWQIPHVTEPLRDILPATPGSAAAAAAAATQTDVELHHQCLRCAVGYIRAVTEALLQYITETTTQAAVFVLCSHCDQEDLDTRFLTAWTRNVLRPLSIRAIAQHDAIVQVKPRAWELFKRHMHSDFVAVIHHHSTGKLDLSRAAPRRAARDATGDDAGEALTEAQEDRPLGAGAEGLEQTSTDSQTHHSNAEGRIAYDLWRFIWNASVRDRERRRDTLYDAAPQSSASMASSTRRTHGRHDGRRGDDAATKVKRRPHGSSSPQRTQTTVVSRDHGDLDYMEAMRSIADLCRSATRMEQLILFESTVNEVTRTAIQSITVEDQQGDKHGHDGSNADPVQRSNIAPSPIRAPDWPAPMLPSIIAGVLKEAFNREERDDNANTTTTTAVKGICSSRSLGTPVFSALSLCVLRGIHDLIHTPLMALVASSPPRHDVQRPQSPARFTRHPPATAVPSDKVLDRRQGSPRTDDQQHSSEHRPRYVSTHGHVDGVRDLTMYYAESHLAPEMLLALIQRWSLRRLLGRILELYLAMDALDTYTGLLDAVDTGMFEAYEEYLHHYWSTNDRDAPQHTRAPPLDVMTLLFGVQRFLTVLHTIQWHASSEDIQTPLWKRGLFHVSRARHLRSSRAWIYDMSGSMLDYFGRGRERNLHVLLQDDTVFLWDIFLYYLSLLVRNPASRCHPLAEEEDTDELHAWPPGTPLRRRDPDGFLAWNDAAGPLLIEVYHAMRFMTTTHAAATHETETSEESENGGTIYRQAGGDTMGPRTVSDPSVELRAAKQRVVATPVGTQRRSGHVQQCVGIQPREYGAEHRRCLHNDDTEDAPLDVRSWRSFLSYPELASSREEGTRQQQPHPRVPHDVVQHPSQLEQCRSLASHDDDGIDDENDAASLATYIANHPSEAIHSLRAVPPAIWDGLTLVPNDDDDDGSTDTGHALAQAILTDLLTLPPDKEDSRPNPTTSRCMTEAHVQTLVQALSKLHAYRPFRYGPSHSAHVLIALLPWHPTPFYCCWHCLARARRRHEHDPSSGRNALLAAINRVLSSLAVPNLQHFGATTLSQDCGSGGSVSENRVTRILPRLVSARTQEDRHQLATCYDPCPTCIRTLEGWTERQFGTALCVYRFIKRALASRLLVLFRPPGLLGFERGEVWKATTRGRRTTKSGSSCGCCWDMHHWDMRMHAHLGALYIFVAFILHWCRSRPREALPAWMDTRHMISFLLHDDNAQHGSQVLDVGPPSISRTRHHYHRERPFGFPHGMDDDDGHDRRQVGAYGGDHNPSQEGLASPSLQLNFATREEAEDKGVAYHIQVAVFLMRCLLHDATQSLEIITDSLPPDPTETPSRRFGSRFVSRDVNEDQTTTGRWGQGQLRNLVKQAFDVDAYKSNGEAMLLNRCWGSDPAWRVSAAAAASVDTTSEPPASAAVAPASDENMDYREPRVVAEDKEGGGGIVKESRMDVKRMRCEERPMKAAECKHVVLTSECRRGNRIITPVVRLLILTLQLWPKGVVASECRFRSTSVGGACTQRPKKQRNQDASSRWNSEATTVDLDEERLCLSRDAILYTSPGLVRCLQPTVERFEQMHAHRTIDFLRSSILIDLVIWSGQRGSGRRTVSSSKKSYSPWDRHHYTTCQRALVTLDQFRVLEVAAELVQDNPGKTFPPHDSNLWYRSAAGYGTAGFKLFREHVTPDISDDRLLAALSALLARHIFPFR